jgi:protein-disulfide isomerase
MRLTNMNFLRLLPAMGVIAFSLTALPVLSQSAAPPGSGDPFKDTAAFKPPAGARVAIVEFQDLECPACAHAFPIVHQAVAHYGIPLVEKDFPLRQHIWSFDAAVWARYLQDKVSPKVADDYRGAIFVQQLAINSKDDMLNFTRRFFQSHGVQMPFVPDPGGVLTKEVEADRTLGNKIGLEHTPTIVVCNQHEWVQVTDVSLLYQTIDEVMAKAGPAPAAKATTVKKPVAKTAH